MRDVKGCTCGLTSGGMPPHVPHTRGASWLFRWQMCDVRHGCAKQGLPRGSAGVAGIFMHCYGVHMVFFVDRKSRH